MKYRIIRDCMIEGAKARAGDVLQLSDRDGRNLVWLGRAVPEEAITNSMNDEQPLADRQVKKVVRRGNNRKTTAKNQSR